MKKTLLTLALVAATAAAFGQGKISFGNDSVHLFVIGQALPGDTGGGTTNVGDATGSIPISPLPSGKSLEAVLYVGQGSGAASLNLQTTLVLTGGNWLSAGRMQNSGQTLTFPGGAPGATFDIFVVDTGTVLPSTSPTATLGATVFATATYFGSSGVFTATPGSSFTFPAIVSGGPASSTWTPGNLQINAVPEPASFALFGLGAAAMLIFRRRK